MKKIKLKTLYLIGIITIGLIGLATKSTYELFTSSTEIDNPICMATNLTSEEEVVDTMDVVVASVEVKEVPITINNTSNSTLNYMVFYENTSKNVELIVNMSNSDSSNSFGTININETKKVYVQIKNNESTSITITLGVVSNNISSNMRLVPYGKDGENGFTSGTNLAEYITSLYTDTSKTIITNNSITYNSATNAGLMNDRLGSTTTDMDSGNIRYYGYASDLEKCQKQLSSYSDSTCTGNNWMKNIITSNGTINGWFLSPGKGSYAASANTELPMLHIVQVMLDLIMLVVMSVLIMLITLYQHFT